MDAHQQQQQPFRLARFCSFAHSRGLSPALRTTVACSFAKSFVPVCSFVHPLTCPPQESHDGSPSLHVVLVAARSEVTTTDDRPSTTTYCTVREKQVQRAKFRSTVGFPSNAQQAVHFPSCPLGGKRLRSSCMPSCMPGMQEMGPVRGVSGSGGVLGCRSGTPDLIT